MVTSSRHPQGTFLDLANIDGHEGRGNTQGFWYGHFLPWLRARTLLDVGSGHSRIKEHLAPHGTQITTHEMCASCATDLHGPLDNIPSAAYDVVSAFDVIEHVKPYGELVANMARIARRHIIITTPNYAVTRNTNPYHWHEFYADELFQLLDATGMVYERGFSVANRMYPDGRFEGICDRWDWTREELISRDDLQPIGVIYRHRTILPL